MYSPVCGLDGVTYSNACSAKCEGNTDKKCEVSPIIIFLKVHLNEEQYEILSRFIKVGRMERENMI